MIHVDAALAKAQLALRVETEKLVATPTVTAGHADFGGVRPAERVKTLDVITANIPQLKNNK